MKKILLASVVAGLLMLSTGCLSIHTNQGASATPTAGVVTPQYLAETELGAERVSAEVTGKSVLGIISWGMPSEFADNGSFGANGQSAGSASIIPIPFVGQVIGGGQKYDKMKQAATYIACKNAGCDYLLDSHYTISTTNYVVFEKVNCKVSGIPVKITGYKPLPACEK
jgi:hypothetical protein